MINNNLISVILPTFNFIESTSKALDALACQTLSPSEVIIIDSSPNHGIEDLAKKYEDRLNIVYFSIPKAYPGEARNIGISKAAGRYIGFLD